MRDVRRRWNPLYWAAKGAIWFYRNAVSPYRPPHCRFRPTCSAYAEEALDRFGFFRGSFLSIRRILRCNPFCRGGYDPVPSEFSLFSGGHGKPSGRSGGEMRNE